MSDRFYSVEQVAAWLELHVRTVRNYIRDGRLPAVRIGKQYRIAHEDLEAFAGRPVPPLDGGPAERRRHSEASSIVEIEGVGPETADRLNTLLVASVADRGPGARPLRIETVYDKDRARMKVVVLGGLADTARLFAYIEGVLTS
ncbi:helix-turn-helix domain-containing protein [Streptomyces sp. NPDC093707]|uniref:helix-turn-helix domain-containing protein n=1 Tax=Streptomyces sp. NPDC093707 TaxID=3154984 RepID=UPI00344CADBF